MGSCPDTDIDPFFFLFPRFYRSKSPYHLLRHGIPINHGEIHRFVSYVCHRKSSKLSEDEVHFWQGERAYNFSIFVARDPIVPLDKKPSLFKQI